MLDKSIAMRWHALCTCGFSIIRRRTLLQNVLSAIGSDESITAHVLRYQKTGSGFAELVKRIAPLIYNVPKLMRNASEDDCGDFYCYFVPRLSRIIDRFVYSGKEFEVYLNTSMKWQYKSFIAKNAKRSLLHTTVKNSEFWSQDPDYGDPTLACERPSITQSARSHLGVNTAGVICNPVIARRLLLLTLKASQEITSDTIVQVSELIKVDSSWLIARIQELNTRLTARRERRERLRQRRDRAYFRMCYFQKKISTEVDASRRQNFTRLMRAEREHLANARSVLSRVPISPTHRDIAAILQIPKGSVDSALYYIRNSCRNIDTDVDTDVDAGVASEIDSDNDAGTGNESPGRN